MSRLALGFVVLAVACGSDKRQPLLVVDVTKAADVGALDAIRVAAGAATGQWTSDAPTSIGVYLPPGFAGAVQASVDGLRGGMIAGHGTGSAMVAPGETRRLSVVLTRDLGGDGGVDAPDAGAESAVDLASADRPREVSGEAASDLPSDPAVEPAVEPVSDPVPEVVACTLVGGAPCTGFICLSGPAEVCQVECGEVGYCHAIVSTCIPCPAGCSMDGKCL